METRSGPAVHAGTSGTAVPERWGFWRSGPATGLRNMAVDAALLERAVARSDDGIPLAIWRVYSWSTPTVSFGRNEATARRFTAESVAAAGLDVVRRPTGGRALLHAREITYSVAFPLASDVSWRVAYDAVNCLLRDALHSIGVHAQIAPDHGLPSPEGRVTGDTRPLLPDGPLCFDRPAPGELVVGHAKLAASAVWRERGGFLQHGSILLHDDQALLLQAAATPVPAPSPGACLRDFFPGDADDDADADLDDDALRALVERALEQQLAARAVVTPVHAWTSMQADIARWSKRFSEPGWLWRR
ncbi:MAG TPA: hypothetical protein VE869_06060 [Gemmatimonas sp.]|nr:hypothetical protein [Gemmatimonas sp.]